MKTLFINIIAVSLVIGGFFSTGNPVHDSWLGFAALCALIFLAAEFYLLPFWIGLKRNVNSLWALLLVNFFLGWSGIGWFTCLIWAVCGRTFNEDEIARIQLATIANR